MAGVWRLYGHWRKNGRCYVSHTEIFYLHLIPYFGFAHYLLSHSCFLDEYKKLHQKFPEEPRALSLEIDGNAI